MERVLALALWGVIALGTMMVTLLGRAGALETRPEWVRDLSAPTGFWIMLVPLFYVAVCEFVRPAKATALFGLTRSIGILLIVASIFLFGWVIFAY